MFHFLGTPFPLLQVNILSMFWVLSEGDRFLSSSQRKRCKAVSNGQCDVRNIACQGYIFRDVVFDGP